MNLSKIKVQRLLFWQFVWCWLCLVVSVFVSEKANKACFSSIVVIVFPQVINIFLCFLYQGALNAKKVVNLFYIAEFSKLLLTGILIFIVFYNIDLDINWFFVSYFGALSAYFLVPIILEKDF